MNKKKKILLAGIAVALAAAGLLTWVLVPREPTQEVKVYDFNMVGYVNYYNYGTESYGMVTTDRVQAIMPSDTQKVTEILVYQGQEVKKGDVLYKYDTTLSDLELERKDLSIQQMEVNLKNAQAELKTLKSMKPMVIPSGSGSSNKPEEDEKIDQIPSTAVQKVPFAGKGTYSAPYYVWLTAAGALTDGDIEDLFVLAKDGTPQPGNSIYVIICQATRAGGTISYQTGVKYTWVETTDPEPTDPEPTEPEPTEPKPTEPKPTDPEPTNPEPTEPKPTEPEPTDPEPTEPKPTEPSDPAPSTPADPTDPSEETNPSQTTQPLTNSNANARAKTQTVLRSFTMSFFNPERKNVADTTKDDIVWNSGYTSSELASMRQEKSKEIDDLTFQIKIGKAELKIMEKEADNGQVTAEFDGIVASVLEPQNAREVGAPMIKVVGGGGYYVEGAVSELDLATIQVGQTVTVTSWENYVTCEGTVVEIGQYPTEDGNYFSYGSANVSYYPYKVFIDESADLQEGYYVSMTYQAEASEEGTMYLENAFLRSENGEYFVYVRNEEGLLEKRVVQIGDNSNGYNTVILSGLSETDYIAFPYGKEVAEGAPTAEGTYDDLYGY